MDIEERDGARLIRLETRRRGDESYEYRLYSEKSRRVASFGLTLYSVAVTHVARDRRRCGANVINGFSDCRKATRFFERLVAELIGPMALGYVYESETNT